MAEARQISQEELQKRIKELESQVGSVQKMPVQKGLDQLNKLGFSGPARKEIEGMSKNAVLYITGAENTKRTFIAVDLERSLVEINVNEKGKILNIHREVVPAKDISKEIVWTEEEKSKLSAPQTQEIKLKETLLAAPTASNIKDPLPAIKEPPEILAKPLPKVNLETCKSTGGLLITELSSATEELQSEIENTYNAKRMKSAESVGEASKKPITAMWELATKPGTESLRVLLGVYDANLTTFECYRSDMNDKITGLTYIKTFLGKGKSLEEIQKLTAKDFKNTNEYDKFSNALKFLESNLKDSNRVHNYIGDISTHLGLNDLAATHYQKASNVAALENVQHVKVMSSVLDILESSTSATGVLALEGGTILMQAWTPLWLGANNVLSKLPKIKKAMEALEATKVCYHTTNAKGLEGVLQEGKILMSGTKFKGPLEKVTKGVWTSVEKPILNTIADYSFSFELKYTPALEKNAVKIWDLFGRRNFLTMGVKSDISLAENWTGRIFVTNEQKAAEAINILEKTGTDMSKVQVLVRNKTISDVAARQVATRLTGDTGWIIHEFAPATGFTFLNYLGQHP